MKIKTKLLKFKCIKEFHNKSIQAEIDKWILILQLDKNKGLHITKAIQSILTSSRMVQPYICEEF